MSDGFLPPSQETPPAPEAAVPQEELSPVKQDELVLEQIAAGEQEDKFLETAEASAEAPPVAEGEQPAEAAPAVEAPKDELLEAVEKILEEELGTYDKQFTPEVKTRFEQQGKEVARELTARVRKNAAAPRKVFGAIEKWLQTIPQVNKHFLTQAAKIKTDQLLALQQREHQKPNPNQIT